MNTFPHLLHNRVSFFKTYFLCVLFQIWQRFCDPSFKHLSIFYSVWFFSPKCQALVSFVKHLCFIFTSVPIFLLSVWHLCFFLLRLQFYWTLVSFLLCLYYLPKCEAPVFFFSVLISPRSTADFFCFIFYLSVFLIFPQFFFLN